MHDLSLFATMIEFLGWSPGKSTHLGVSYKSHCLLRPSWSWITVTPMFKRKKSDCLWHINWEVSEDGVGLHILAVHL